MLGSNPRLKRVCYACGSDKTRIHYQYHKGVKYTKYNWHLNRGTNLVLCHDCYTFIIRREYNRKRMATRVTFRNRRTITHQMRRVGVCNLCRAVLPFDCLKTDLNHYTYNDNNPLEGILETCVSCHSKYHTDLKQTSEYRKRLSDIAKEIWRKRKEDRDIN